VDYRGIAMVDTVLRSSIKRILRSSRICMKQERERWVGPNVIGEAKVLGRKLHVRRVWNECVGQEKWMGLGFSWVALRSL